MRVTSVGLCACLWAAIGGCSGSGSGAETEAGAEVRLVQVPASITCLRIAFQGTRTATRSLSVTPGETSTYTLRGLPAGQVQVSASAYELACDAVTASSLASWASDPLDVFLTAGASNPITLTLRRVGAASDVTVDFVTECGDGIVEDAEACDDGNVVSGDGCSATCTLEADGGAGGSLETVMRAMPVSIPAQGEVGTCEVVEVGLVAARQIAALGATFSAPAVGRVLVVSRTTDAVAAPAPCSVYAALSQAIFVAQGDATLVLPEQAAIPLAAVERLRIGVLAENPTASTLALTATVRFDLLPASVAPRAPASLFVGLDTQIAIPPQATHTEQGFYILPAGAHGFAFTSRTHRFGILASITSATSALDTTGTLLHQSTDWEASPLTVPATPFAFAAGTGIQVRCEYSNTSDVTVSFGDSLTDEVCMGLVYLY